MHVAIFSDYTFHSLGGIQTSLRAQCYELIRQGHQVTVACPRPRDQTELLPGLRFVEVDPMPFLLMGYIFVLPTKGVKKRVIQKLQQLEKIDVIHCHTNMGVGVIAIAASQQLDVPLVQSFHGREDIVAEKNPTLPRLSAWFFSSLHGFFMPHTKSDALSGSYISRQAWAVMQTHASYARHIIAPSNHFLAVFRDHGYTGPATVVSNGIDDSVVERITQMKVSPSQKPVIVWVGRLWPEKQPEVFVEAARLLPQYDFVMCGDGILRDKIKKIMPSNLSLFTDRNQNQVLEMMKTSTLFVHTAQNFDTQSMVLLEAIVAELPAIIMDKNLRETVPEPGSVLVDGGPDELATVIDTLVKDHKKLDSMRTYLRSLQPSVRQSFRTREAVTVYNIAIDEAKKYSAT